ncbi:MAG: ATP-grasp domain-containing protein [Planctomycetota bacterium]|nr:MAG: ATP-grasp domain-containing protein [Planctomycetota bacterium]
MKRRLNITVLVDTTAIPSNDPEFKAAPKVPTTEHHVIGSLRTLQHKVSVLGAANDIGTIINSLKELKPDIVFNLTEQFAGDRQMDKNITALLELTDIPFTGSGPTGLMLCRDKRLCKQLLSLHKIRVPGFIYLPRDHLVVIPKKLRYPLVVKPAFEDSSEGISNASLVANETALRDRAKFVHERWQQAAIAEEYIEGRELYISILGNKRLVVFPIRECLFDFNTNEGPQLATYRVKWNEEFRKKWNIEFGFAKLEPSILRNIERTCKRVYRVLQIRDYGRIDLRLTPENKLVILEANPNPDIAYGEDVAEAAEKAGISYEELIERILFIALRRYDRSF